jgi:hypothetical protein
MSRGTNILGRVAMRARAGNLSTCAASLEPCEVAHPGPPQASPLSKALAGRTLLRLDPVAPPATRPLEFYPQNFLGFVQLACLLILFRPF